jgi:molecular chaperone HscC
LLSHQETATVRVPNRAGQFDENAPSITITRQEFERWTESILARVELPVHRALGDAGLKRSDIDEVILVGGAMRMPSVVARVETLFGKPPLRRINSDEVVALGAAIQAGLIACEARLDDLVVTDVAPFSLGIAISKRFGLEHRPGYYLPIISRNTTISVSKVETVSTIQPNQTELMVQIYQGEGRRIEDNLPLGESRVTGIPRGPAGQMVDIRFTYDLNGVLKVEVTVHATCEKFRHVIIKHVKGLTPVQIARVVKAVQALKTHPREEAPNRLLLRRAERLYDELSADARIMLDQLLDGFEEALELNDRAAIDRYREALTEFLDCNDPEQDSSNAEGEDASW